MRGFFSDLLSGLDCCEREAEKIFCFKGKVKIVNPHNRKNSCPCSNKKEEELECECECKCKEV